VSEALLRLVKRLGRRFRALTMPASFDRELDEEMRFHIEAEAADLVRLHGIPPAEGRRRALAAFRGMTQTREAHREARGGAVFDTIARNVRYAGRSVRRRPGFAAAVVLTIALGIGANAATFSVIDRLLFRPPPMLREPSLVHRVYLAYSSRPELGREVSYHEIMPFARYKDITTVTHFFARTAMDGNAVLAVGDGANAREAPVGAVSASFFGFFDAPPALGRYFSAQEDMPPSGTPVAVLSYGLWQTRFAGRSDALGAPLRIGATLYTVVGVTPRGFVGLWPEDPPAAFVPISSYAAGLPFWAPGEAWWTTAGSFASMLVELKPGIPIAAAEAELTDAVDRGWNPRGPVLPPRAIAGSFLSDRGPTHTSLAKVASLIGGMGLIVLLIAGANVANLLLARFLSRRPEIAVRRALGASRSRVLSEALTESVLLAALGGLAGLVLAQAGGSALRSALVSPGALSPIAGDPQTLIFVGLAVVAVGVLTGLLPASEAAQVDPVRYLTAGRHGETRRVSWARGALLLTQTGLSAVLLVGAGLFVRSLANVRQLHLGYEPTRVLTVHPDMRGVRLDSAQNVSLRQRLLVAAQHVPDVERAALNLALPFHDRWLAEFQIPGMDSADRIKLGLFYLDAVSPDYFATLGTRIVRGRGIQAGDVAGAPGAIVVSQSIAKLLWPRQDPIGQCVRIASDKACRYVVGVSEDIKFTQLSDDPGFVYYVSAAQYWSPKAMGLVLLVRGDAAHEREVIRRALQPDMPGDSYLTVTPLDDLIGQQTRSWRLGATMFTVSGLLALTLAAIGLYGVISYTVARRTHEIGVRITLGARAGSVLWLGVRQGLLLAGLGTSIGVLVAVAFARSFAPLMFNESPWDPLVYLTAAGLILTVAAAASIIPAGRAARLDPSVTLRSE
jgi:putative ABC transport system permease protein